MARCTGPVPALSVLALPILAMIVSAAIALPTVAAAASLSPLGDTMGMELDLPGLGAVPGLPDTVRGPGLRVSTGIATPPVPFKFMDDTGLDANPLRSILPENQWANPQAAQTDLIRRR